MKNAWDDIVKIAKFVSTCLGMSVAVCSCLHGMGIDFSPIWRDFNKGNDRIIKI